MARQRRSYSIGNIGFLDPKVSYEKSADCRSMRWKAAEVVHNRISNIPARRPSKKFGLQIWSMLICSLAYRGLRPNCAKYSLWLELAGGGPEWVHCMRKAPSISIYGIVCKDLRANLDGDEMLT